MMTVKLAFAFLLAFPFVAAAQTTRTVTRPHIVGLSHIALYCHDIDKSRAFYKDFLGFAGRVIDAINHALRNIPRDRVRMRCCICDAR